MKKNGLNTLGQAIYLAETKYIDNTIVQALLSSFKYSRNEFKFRKTKSKLDKFSGYAKGLEGLEGYYSSLDGNSANLLFDEFRNILYLKEANAKGECLILVLQALGEDLEL